MKLFGSGKTGIVQGKIISLILVFLAFSTVLEATSREVWVLYRSEIPLFREICRLIPPTQGFKPVFCPTEKISRSFLESRPPDLIIALGESGVKKALETQWEVPIITAFVDQPPDDPRVRFLDLHQPHARQMELLRRCGGTWKSLLYPYSSEKFAPSPDLIAESGKQGFSLRPLHLDSPKKLPEFLRLMGEFPSPVLLPVDPEIMNSAVFPAILREGLRWSVPLVGFSEAIVQGGALFAFAVVPPKAARELIDYAKDCASTGGGEAIRFRKFESWALYLNQTLAKKLNLLFPAELLRAAEKVY